MMATCGRFAELDTGGALSRRAPPQAALRALTLPEYTFEPVATFPLHRHAQEQVTLVEPGEVHLTTAGATEVPVRRRVVRHAGRGGARDYRRRRRGAPIVAILSPRRTDSANVTVTLTTDA
jgi:hypothetical protein